MTTFSGIDIVLDRRLDQDQIRRGVAEVLSVEPTWIDVIDDVALYPEPEAARVVCVVTQVSGEFVEVISIQCEPLELPFLDDMDVVQRLSLAFRACVLAAHDDPDPCVMWLVEPGQKPRQVSLDEAALDEDRYEIRVNGA